ncbi:ATP-binding protein [Desulfobacca acetoxidans]|uniref:histidine kinase n=1 Tax=Desulfobacca acetoxidans (strain ATCC 700848 / DSM 11109 / ASRB2) TaxID=880072 RepID=F2NEN0_DESAR|nr:ATP-binding protein [Desulfobacca acetoxidans]AEB08220.1 integral membrane sensor signal transduction histidine kinase [Desulfobacca acetoxidans DSM 11109]
MFRRLKIAWRPAQKDLETFRLVKFFTLTGFVVIVVFTVLLTLLVADRLQQMALKKSEDYASLLAANLNHQVFQQFVLPAAIRFQGRIQISDPEQYELLDTVVRNTIHGFHVQQVNIYDQRGDLAYSTDSIELGKNYLTVPEVKQSLDHGDSNIRLVVPKNILVSMLLGSKQDKYLKTFNPLRLESVEIKLTRELGPVIGVFEITQDISLDMAEIGKFQLMLIATLIVLMGLLFMVLRQIVKKAESILERRQEERKELQAQLELAERLAALGEMVAGVAHEIRNPLGIISSTAELLRKRLEANPSDGRLAQIIEEEVNRLNQTVTEFLDFARPREPNLQPTDIERILERGLEFLQPEIDRSQISLERHYQLNGQVLKADSELLYRAFLNIFINAIQAMPQGGRLIVATEPGPQNKGARIIIQDSGEGISSENVKKIFNPFFTTKDKGSGLGLSIVKGIVESHQGQIHIESNLNCGAKVIITLPELEA